MFLPPETHRLKDGASVTIRSAREEDAAPLLATIRAYIAQNDGMAWEPGEYRRTEAEIKSWIGVLRDSKCEILLLALQEDEVLANIDFQIGARRRMRHTGEFGMGVAPAHRRRGVGGLLLGRMIQWARGVPQIERIGLRVISNNAAAIGLYKKFGFEEEGRRRRLFKYADGVYADDVFMRLDIERAASPL